LTSFELTMYEEWSIRFSDHLPRKHSTPIIYRNQLDNKIEKVTFQKRLRFNK